MAVRIQPEEWRPQGEKINDLERDAWEAVRSTDHSAVTAGPGAGKTELLAQRACYLLQTGICPFPSRILALTFKVDAAKNLRERVKERCGPELARRFESYTYASFAMQLLRRGRLALPDWCRPTEDFRPLLNPNLKRFLQQPPRTAGSRYVEA
jgi:DNA helicase II / ATP-dependent DNA helicase PcrA